MNLFLKRGATMKDNNRKDDTRKDINNKKKKKRKKGIIISTIFLLLAIVSFVLGSLYFELNKIKNTKISQSNEDLGISKETEERTKAEDPDGEIINIALFGIDRRSKNEASRSDALLIATIDKKSKKIKLSSIMRDLYVNIPGRGKDKITHAYAYGGPQLAIRTLNQNFQLDIKDYVTVDFFGLEKIINSLGGVSVNVKKEEVEEINFYIKEQAALEGVSPSTLKKSGVQNLNGIQAVAYSRIRHVGNGDYQRTERQKAVLTALFNKVQQGGITKYPAILSAVLPYTETSMSKGDLISLGTSVLTSGTKTLDQIRFPLDKHTKSQTIGGVYYLVSDLKTLANHMHGYIYEDIRPE
jgi:polyisoprenyl-teichoic acid--peptidoglycan teichoic acid transferase